MTRDPYMCHRPHLIDGKPCALDVKVAMSRWARFEDRRCGDVGLWNAFSNEPISQYLFDAMRIA